MNKKGFTLIEILVVCTLVVILVLLAVPAVNRSLDSSRNKAFVKEARTIVSAVKNTSMADSNNYDNDYGDIVVYKMDSINTALDKKLEDSPFGSDYKAAAVLIKRTYEIGGAIKYTRYICLVDKNGNGFDFTEASKVNSKTVKHNMQNVTCESDYSLHKVTVVVNGGTVPFSNQDVVHGEKAEFNLSVSNGYDSNLVTVNCTNDQTATVSNMTLTTGEITQDTVCTVNFKKNIYYTVSVSAVNGSISGASTKSVLENGTISFVVNPNNEYIYNNTSCTNGQSATYSSSILATGPLTSNSHCTVNFKAKTYSIAYNLNGGSVSSNPTSYTIETNTFTLNNPTKTGYTFSGWTGSNGSTPATSVSISQGSTGDKNYTANWIPNTYTISLNNQGATSAGTSAIYQTYATKFSLTNGGVAMTSSSNPITKPTKTGYTFAGYYTATTSGVQYIGNNGYLTALSDNKHFTANGTLYAHWTANTYVISFNANGGSGGQSGNVLATYASPMPAISTVAPTRTGYTFKGWYDTSADSGGTQYYTAAGASARSYDKTSNTTLYARWSINSYNVTYNYSQNGGTSATKTTDTIVYNSNVDLTPTATKSGWTFVGWNTNKDATSKLDTLRIGANNVTLYAIYRKEAINRTITFYKNGNTSFTYSGTKYTDTSKTFNLCTIAAVYNNSTQATNCSATITMPTLEAASGFTAKGWHGSSTGTASPTYTSGQTNVYLTANSNLTYYGQSQKAAITHTVTFYKNGAYSQTNASGTAVTDNTVTRTCTRAAVYNGATQASSCSVTSPTIVAASGFTVVEYNTTSSATSSSWSHNTQKTGITGNLTYYAITKSSSALTAKWNANGATLSSTSDSSCNRYNGSTSCVVTAPTITRSGFTITGFGTSASATTKSLDSGGTLTLTTSNTGSTWYAITSKVITLTFYRNGNTSQTNASGTAVTSDTVTRTCTIQNSATSCAITSPTMVAPSGFTINGYSTGATTYSGYWTHNSQKTGLTANANWYAQSTKAAITHTATFYKNGASTQTNANGTAVSDNTVTRTCTRAAVHNGASQATSCNITSPTIVAATDYSVVGYNTTSSATSSSWNHNTQKTGITSNLTYYAITRTTIAYNAGGGCSSASGLPSTGYKYYGANATLSTTAPTCSGKVFLGWSTTSNATASSSWYDGGATYSTNAKLTLYAQWYNINSLESSYTTYVQSGDFRYEIAKRSKTGQSTSAGSYYSYTDTGIANVTLGISGYKLLEPVGYSVPGMHRVYNNQSGRRSATPVAAYMKYRSLVGTSSATFSQDWLYVLRRSATTYSDSIATRINRLLRIKDVALTYDNFVSKTFSTPDITVTNNTTVSFGSQVADSGYTLLMPSGYTIYNGTNGANSSRVHLQQLSMNSAHTQPVMRIGRAYSSGGDKIVTAAAYFIEVKTKSATSTYSDPTSAAIGANSIGLARYNKLKALSDAISSNTYFTAADLITVKIGSDDGDGGYIYSGDSWGKIDYDDEVSVKFNSAGVMLGGLIYMYHNGTDGSGSSYVTMRSYYYDTLGKVAANTVSTLNINANAGNESNSSTSGKDVYTIITSFPLVITKGTLKCTSVMESSGVTCTQDANNT